MVAGRGVDESPYHHKNWTRRLSTPDPSAKARPGQNLTQDLDQLQGAAHGQTDIAPIALSSATIGTLVNVAGANFQGIAISPNGCSVYGADSSGSNRVVPINAATGAAGTGITVDTSPEDIAVAYPPTTHYYEVEATRNLWTSAVPAQASIAFGQPSHTS